MVELLNQTREQLLEEVQKKEASRVKLKEKLVQLKELSVNTAQVLQLNSTLEQQLAAANKKQQTSTKECKALRLDLKAAHDLTQEANALLTEQERNQQDLQQQLTAAKTSATKAEQSSRQAQAAKAKSDMAFKTLESELAALHTQMAHFQAGLKSVEQQQKADHQQMVHFKSQPVASAPAPAQSMAGTCQGCTAVKEAVVSLQKQIREKDLASAKGSTKANSAASTQDHSGDTLDDMNQLQMQCDIRGLQDQLMTCQDQQEQFEAEMHRWRTLFGSFAALAAPGATALQVSSAQMQISPAGAEGSNVLPRQSPEDQTRREGSRVQNRGWLPYPEGLHIAEAAARPAYGETTAEPGEVMAARVNSTGADSDTFSAAAGTGASLMLPAKQRAPSKRGPQACLNPQVPAGTAPDIPAVPLSPKRKTIALQPGAVPLPDAGRKRRKLAKAGQAEHIKTAQESCHVTQQQSQLKQALPSSGCAASPHLAKYDVPVKDATAVDFMELQLARICNTQEPITASVVSAVAQDIYSAWASKHCPLECILKGFTAVLLDCTAAPAPAITQPSDASKQSPAVTVHSRCEADTSTEVCQTVEDSPFAKLWCSQTACQQHHFTWLMHCAVELDGLLRPSAKAQPDQPHGRAAANITRDPIQPSGALIAPAKGPSTLVKKRGRPPGSKNKKTLLKLQQEDASRDQLPSAKPVQLCTIGQQRQRSEQQQSQHQGEQQQACQQALPQQQKQQLHQQQARQQQQQQAGLPIGTLLDGLHKQVLHCLGQVCQVKSPGPFESEVCCVSAAAASLARLQGKVQGVRAQVMNTLCSVQLTPSIKLQSIAAAVQVWPEALLPPASSTSHSCQDLLQHFGLLGICVHARLQHLCQQHGAKSSTDEQMKQKTAAEVFPSPGKRLGEAGRQLMLRWDRNRMTQIAAQTLHSLLHCSWGQQAEQQDRSAAQLSTEAVKQLPAIAAEQVLAELRELGTTEDADDELVDDRWADLGLALQLMISILGWEWAYEHVLNKLMGPIVSALLKPASDDSGQWAMRNLQHLLQCMVVTVNAVMGNSPQDSTACVVVALEALLQRLTGMADKCASHTVLSGLLSSSAQSMQQHMRKEALPV